ncbi:MAG: hypothetical protein D6744_15785 [Planctomycetota bacterium]|nr:MAG: hypothetical protein D6744_15785 [Planctomycetota bacterium]
MDCRSVARPCEASAAPARKGRRSRGRACWVGVALLFGSAASAAAQTSRPAPDRAALERHFAERLTDAVLVGHWQMTRAEGLAGRDLLSEPRRERYTITGVAKEDEEHWVFAARIEYGETDVTVPLRLRVVWAGDTPVVTLDDVAIPGVGTYSARVLFHENFYAGTWRGDGYGGVLSGQILKREQYERLRERWEQGAPTNPNAGNQPGAASEPAPTDGGT